MNVPPDRREAIIDSCAMSYFCPNKAKFVNFIEITPQKVYTTNSSTVNATGQGDIKIDLPLGSKQTTVTFKDALYTPSMAFTLISTNRIASAGLAILFEGGMCKILSAAPKRRTIMEIPQVQGLYSVTSELEHFEPMLPQQNLP